MAYGQVGTITNITMIGSNGATWSGNWTFHLYPSSIDSFVRGRLYSDVYVSTYSEYTNPDYAAAIVGDWGLLRKTFLTQFLTAVGAYVDIYNTKFGNQIKLRIEATSVGSPTSVSIFLIVFGYSIRLRYNAVLYGNSGGMEFDCFFSCYIDPDNAIAALALALPITNRDRMDIYGLWTGDSSVNATVKQSLYTLLTYGGGGGGGGNPYIDGGLNTDPAGGEDQNFDETSDTILEPTLPSNPATGSGFITAYVPTLTEINRVADYLIDPNVLQALAGTVLKLSDVVIGLSIFPFTIAATGSKEIKMNLCGAHLTTGVTCHYSDSQFVTLNMGSINVKNYWDNCLDYDPYTRITLYLPYVGFVDLDTDEVMGKEITVKYNVDIVTGCCLALIIVDGSVLYQYPGECSCQIPITSVSFDNFLQSAVQLGITAASGARAIKGAGASLAEAGGQVLATDDAGVQRLAMGDYDKERAKFTGIKASVTDSLISASVGAVLSAKGQYSHAGAMSSCAGILGTQKPFLIIKRPKQCLPEGFEGIRGFPCNMKATLRDLEGYTEVGDIHLNIPNATVQEIVECEQFLKEGVYL